MADTARRGLLVPAWTDGANYTGAKVVFADGEYEGMTVAEVASKLRVRAETVRHYAAKGICPSTLRPREPAGAALRRNK